MEFVRKFVASRQDRSCLRAEISSARRHPKPVPIELPGSAVAISKWTFAKEQLSQIWGLSLSILVGRSERRSPKRSNQEYEERWKTRLEERVWQDFGDAETYLALTKGSMQLTALLYGKPYNVESSEYYRWRVRTLGEEFLGYWQLEAEIVELGCGYGKNLLALWSQGFTSLSGLDVSENGLYAARDQFDHFGVNITVDLLDLLDLKSSNWSKIKQKYVFTNYVMEQFPRDLDVVIARLIAAEPREVIHIETVAELLTPLSSLTDLRTLLYTRYRDYQRTLLRVLKQYQTQGFIELLEIRPLGFSPTLRSGASLIRWRPVI